MRTLGIILLDIFYIYILYFFYKFSSLNNGYLFVGLKYIWILKKNLLEKTIRNGGKIIKKISRSEIVNIMNPIKTTLKTITRLILVLKQYPNGNNME